MSEEIKFDHFKDINELLEHIDLWYRDDDIEYTRWFGLEDLHILKIYITSLQQKVEQLEKENKELRQPQVFIDCEDMEERYGRDLYEDFLKGKIEQLENIRNEVIEYIKEDLCGEPNELYGLVDGEHLLNILNKGSDKE